jgi:hypothetical protein
MTKRWTRPSEFVRKGVAKDLQKLPIDDRKRRLVWIALHWPFLYAELLELHRGTLGFPLGLEGERRAPKTKPMLIDIAFCFP